MRSSRLFILITALAGSINAQTNSTPVTGLLGDASIVRNNPVGPIYVANLPTIEFFNPADPRGNIKGSVSATAAASGQGVDFTVNFSNLPASGGPFLYHIHVAPVNSSGSCASTLAHLDPFLRGEQPACNASLPATCQVGDLSGKYGKIDSDPFTASYTDLFASTLPGLGSFFGNRSLTLHFANTTRITCASFIGVPGTGALNGTVANATIVSPPPAQFTGATSRITASILVVLWTSAAFMLL